MSKKKSVMRHVVFWGILLTAFTAEGWMDLVCRLLF